MFKLCSFVYRLSDACRSRDRESPVHFQVTSSRFVEFDDSSPSQRLVSMSRPYSLVDVLPVSRLAKDIRIGLAEGAVAGWLFPIGRHERASGWRYRASSGRHRISQRPDTGGERGFHRISLFRSWRLQVERCFDGSTYTLLLVNSSTDELDRDRVEEFENIINACSLISFLAERNCRRFYFCFRILLFVQAEDNICSGGRHLNICSVIA